MKTISSFRGSVPRVVVFSFASCYGCQLQITNVEKHLLDVLGQIDLQYWQLVSNQELPQEFDVAVIEGAVTTEEATEMLPLIRERAQVVIAIGACATTGGIPSLSYYAYEDDGLRVYGEDLPAACGEVLSPDSVKSVIEVDYQVNCCPIDSYAFIDVLHRVLYGSNKSISTTTMCGVCKQNGRPCLYEQGQMCLGLVTRNDCGARCLALGRACNGCGGISPDANIESAIETVKKHGLDPQLFAERLELFNARALFETSNE